MKEGPRFIMVVSMVNNGRSLGMATASLSSIEDCRKGFVDQSFSNLEHLFRQRTAALR